MDAIAAPADTYVVSKAEFARRRGVSPGRVSQWISEGKIFGPALSGDGRSARIVEAVAVEQLRRKLDPMQMTGNGLGTRLTLAPDPAPVSAQAPATVLPFTPPAPAASRAPVDTVEEQIKQERLAALRSANRRAAEEEARREGILTDAVDASAQMRKIAAQMISLFEGGLPEIATAISAKWQLPQRDVLHLLRSEFRSIRATAATAMKKTADTLAPQADLQIAGDDTPETDNEETALC